MLETIVGFVALGISIFAVAISIVFYFKSDALYKEMLKFISEIRVFSERTYMDTFGMVKEAWPHIWEKIPKESIEKESDEKIKQIKEDISNEMKQEVEKIKKLDIESVKRDQFEKEIGRLEQLLSKMVDETSRRVAEVERERESKVSVQPEAMPATDNIEKEILSMLSNVEGIGAEYIVVTASHKLGLDTGSIANALRRLRLKGLIYYQEPLRHDTWVKRMS